MICSSSQLFLCEFCGCLGQFLLPQQLCLPGGFSLRLFPLAQRQAGLDEASFLQAEVVAPVGDPLCGLGQHPATQQRPLI